MKHITEFFGHSLTAALVKDKELAASGKSPEELASAREQLLTELTKFEGDKLKHFMAALEAIAAKPDRIKRVVVWQVSEGEKAPKAALARDGFIYLVEHFPHAHGPAQPGRKQEENRRGQKGKRGGRHARGRRDDRGRGEGAPRTESGAPEGASGERKDSRRPRRPSRPKGPGPVGIAAQGKPLPKPRSAAVENAPATTDTPTHS